MNAALEPLLLFAGAALVAFGAWKIYAPAAPIVGGVLLVAGVILRSRGQRTDSHRGRH
jgi:hypothetical protein